MAFTEAQIAEMKAAGLSDAAIADLAAFDPAAFQQQQMANQSAITSKDAAALAAAQQSGISNIGYYVNPTGAGDIIPGLVPSIMQNLGMYDPAYWAVMQTYGSEANQANPTDVTEKETFAVNPTLSYRLVDGSGKVLGTANTPQEIAALVAQANQLSQDKGAKAVWSLEQSTIPAGAVTDTNKMGWVPVASDQNSELLDTPMKLILAGMLATTAAGALQPGGFAGAGASSGTAAGAAGGAAAGGAATGAATGGGLLASTVAPAVAAGDIVVTAGGLGALTAGQAAALGAAAGGVGLGAASGSGAGAGAGAAPTPTPTPTPVPGEILVTAPANAGAQLTTAQMLASLGIPLTPFATAPTTAPVAPPTDSGAITVTAPTTMPPAVPTWLIPAGASAAAFGAAAVGGAAAPPPADKGIFGKPIGQWTAGDWLTAASLGGGLLQRIIGQGGGQSGPSGYPYSSGFGLLSPNAGKDMRVNPNITDYETYGFGPEATFFDPNYNKIVSGAMTSSATPTTTPATYRPLING